MQNACPICGLDGVAQIPHSCLPRGYGQQPRNQHFPDWHPDPQKQQFGESYREYAMRQAISRIETELADLKAMLRKVLVE